MTRRPWAMSPQRASRSSTGGTASSSRSTPLTMAAPTWAAASGLRKKRLEPTMAAPRECAMSIMYHDGNRQLQDQFDSRRISDRLEEKLTRTTFTADDKAFIESCAYFFLASADGQGRPD